MEYTNKTTKPELLKHIGCRDPFVIVRTDDESRMTRVEFKALEKSGVPHIYTWDATTNLSHLGSGGKVVVPNLRQLLLWFALQPKIKEASASGTSAEVSAADLIDTGKAPPIKSVLFVFDGLFYLQPNSLNNHSNAPLTREIINMIDSLRGQRKHVFLIGGTGAAKSPPELSTVIPSIDYPLPNLNFLCNTVWGMRQAFCSEQDTIKGRDGGPNMNMEDVEYIAGMLLGLTNVEAERILIASVVENSRKRRLDPNHPVEFDRGVLEEQKRLLIGEHVAIQITMPKPASQRSGAGLDEIGAADDLKEYLLSIPKLMTAAAKEEGIDPPKGIFVYGMGGLGKDAIFKEAAQALGLPLLHGDMAANKGHLQGMSHTNLRKMLAFAEANAPCMLVLSEFEKMMAGAMNVAGAVCDGGTGSEMFGTWLNWMENRTAPVLVIGLANSIENLTQPSLRAGRFDRVYFWDMPDLQGRIEILKIHLAKKGHSWEGMDLEVLAAKLDGYTGAEIKAVVKEAGVQKFLREGTRAEGVLLRQSHLEEAMEIVHSTGRTRMTEILAMRKFATEGGHNRVGGKAIIATKELTKSLTDIAKATPVEK